MRNDGAVKTLDDLKGSKVGVSTVGSVTELAHQRSRRGRRAGATTGMAHVPIGDDASRIAALKTKSIDGAIVNLARRAQLRAARRRPHPGAVRRLVKDFHVHVIFATDKAIAGKPEALRGFLAGWFETIAFMRKDKAKTVEIARRSWAPTRRPPSASTTS